jgi:hypothetical protein
VHALSREIKSALAAIENNDLSQLQFHIAAQEKLCHELLPISDGSASSTHDNEPGAHTPDQEVRQAYKELAQLNRIYAAVLKRARKTAALTAAIYRAHRQGYDLNPSATANHHTWSCEV